MNDVWKFIARAIVLISCAFVGACGGDSSGDPGNPELADVVYEGGTNDEALELLVAATPVDEPVKGARLTWPPDGDAIAASDRPQFWWSAATANVRRRRMRRHHSMEWSWFLTVPVARAHGAPLNGRAYFVVFRSAQDADVVRVFSTALSYTPDESSWEKLKSAPQPITAEILSATYDNNSLSDSGRVARGGKGTFTIQP